MDDALRIYRRHLPHWRLNACIYFVTWRLADTQQELSIEERGFIVAELRSRQAGRYQLLAYVVMNDHVHVLVEPIAPWTLERITYSWKSFTAYRLQRTQGRRGRIWQEEYFDRIVRDDREFSQKVAYIWSNPSRRWPEIEQYPWVRALEPSA